MRSKFHAVEIENKLHTSSNIILLVNKHVPVILFCDLIFFYEILKLFNLTKFYAD